MLIGEKYRSNLIWIQVHDTSQSMKENDLRFLLNDIKTHVLRNRIDSGSARKFKDGKLAFYEIAASSQDGKHSKVYCLYTQERKVGSPVKNALQAIADRGAGYNVYSASRFFSEMMDLIQNPELMEAKLELSEEDVLERVEYFYEEAYDVNELGQIISFLTKSEKLDYEILDKIYIHVYESLQYLIEGSLESDPDEFLDASYIVARSYEEMGNYPMSLELFKYIAILAAMNQRYDLETDCKIRIGIIYKNYFPPHGDYIIETLSTVAQAHLFETSKPSKEIYYSLLGYAYALEGNHKKATSNYHRAIEVAGVNISSPLWIADAYRYLGDKAQDKYNYMEAVRLYLTAATIAFTEGDVTKADTYRNKAANTEIEISNTYIKSALSLRLEYNETDAEYRAWMAIRYLLRGFNHATIQSRISFLSKSREILEEAKEVLRIPGSIRKNHKIINRIIRFTETLQDFKGSVEQVPDKLEPELKYLEERIEANIKAPPPTFMLLNSDGQLVLMGEIKDGKWVESELKGVILGGILVAIMSLIREVTGKALLRTIDAGNFRIMLERSKVGIVALLLDRDIPKYREKLQEALNFINENYEKHLKYWQGKKSVFNSLKNHLIDIFDTPEMEV